MIKLIVMINKRPDLTSEQFRHHYETVHAPLVERLMPYYSAYRRNYVDGAVRSGRALECDVFTELEFATASDYDAWLANLDRPEVLEQIRADEANFLEAGATRMWAVSTFSSDFSDRQPNEGEVMRAVHIHGPQSFRLDDVATPSLGPDDALVTVKACGVCGSDLAYIDRGQAGFRAITGLPSAIGHEAAGEVAALGANVSGLRVGDRVAINPIDPVARNAIGNGAPEGAFADVVRVRNVASGGRLIKLPEGLGYDVAALAEPMGVALHSVNRTQADQNSQVVVLGVGPIGLGAVIWLKHLGVRHVVAVDMSAERLARAGRMGADAVIQAGQGDLESQLVALHGEGARGAPGTDIFLDAAGSPAALQEIIGFAKFGAHVVIVAVYKAPVPLDLSAMLHKEMVLTTSMGYPTELEKVVAFLGDHRELMADYISDQFPLSAFDDAVTAARQPSSAKIMVYTA